MQVLSRSTAFIFAIDALAEEPVLGAGTFQRNAVAAMQIASRRLLSCVARAVGTLRRVLRRIVETLSTGHARVR